MVANGMQFLKTIKGKATAQENRAVALGMLQARARMQKELEENAEYQARCRMTQDERRLEAIDISAKNRAERKQIGFEQAKQEIIELVTPAYMKVDTK